MSLPSPVSEIRNKCATIRQSENQSYNPNARYPSFYYRFANSHRRPRHISPGRCASTPRGIDIPFCGTSFIQYLTSQLFPPHMRDSFVMPVIFLFRGSSRGFVTSHFNLSIAQDPAPRTTNPSTSPPGPSTEPAPRHEGNTAKLLPTESTNGTCSTARREHGQIPPHRIH